MTELIDQTQQQGTPILRLAEPRAENALTRERYQRQLCLPLGEVERLLGPQLISSVAVTGGDPYFRTGTDVAVLFETKNTAALLSAHGGIGGKRPRTTRRCTKPLSAPAH